MAPKTHLTSGNTGSITRSLSTSGHLSRLPTVRGCMARNLYVFHPDMPIMKAVDVLLDHQISGAPVVDRKTSRLVGILSEKDCLLLVAKGQLHEEPAGVVADYMTKEVDTIPPEMDIYYAAGLFINHSYRRLPVVSEDGELVGQVSRRDILRVVRDNLKAMLDASES